MHSGAQWRLGHRPALDGLRGVAVLMVVACHALPGIYAAGGRAGVAIFFTLSGFLITSGLLEHGADMRQFYARRARRLLPAVAAFLSAMVALSFVVGPWLATPAELIPPLLYLQNVAVIVGAPTGGLTHLWSLSVEEQFYSLWPVAFVLLVRSRYLLPATALAVVASLAVRLALLATGASATRIYMGSDTNACLLLLGCLLAVLLHTRPVRAIRSGWAVMALAGALTVGLVPDSRWMAAAAPVVAATLAAVLVLNACGATPLHTPRWLAGVGKRSYALYLWHYPLVALVPAHIPLSRWVTVPAMIGLAWLASAASWRFVEQPLLRRRSSKLLDEELRRVRRRGRRLVTTRPLIGVQFDVIASREV